MDQVSVIIPALNEYYYLPHLLESLAHQTYKGQLQVIVVDGKSEDNTAQKAAEFANRFDDLLVLTAERDVGHQRNVGANHAKYPYLIFFDADVVLPLNFLEALAAQVHGDKPFIGAVMHMGEKMSLIDYASLVAVYGLGFLAWLARMPFINGDCMVTTRANHQRVGGFVEGAILGEDTDYGFRSIRAGAKYRFFMRPHVIASDRRITELGVNRWTLLWTWSRAFLKVKRHGPTFEGVEYPFGRYGKPKTRKP